MTDFIWPSDQDRAENDELNRVCEYLEEVLAERDTLAAHVERLREAITPFAAGGAAGCISRGDYSVMRERLKDWLGVKDFEMAAEALRENPPTSLARQKLLWQAEAVETAVARGYRSRDELAGWAEHLRRQAEENSNG